MTPPAETAPGARSRSLPPWLLALGVWALGMAMAHGSMIGSSLGRVQGNLGVPRMTHYLLEHAIRWMAGDPLHARFWDPPIFHPAGNTEAYTDLNLGVSPFYAVWRIFGAPLDLAYPLWLLLVSSLNFWSAYLFFRDALRRSGAASAFGAFFFAFASIRIAYLGLPQLLPAFYGLLVLHGLIRVLRSESLRQALPWLALYAVGWVGQVYSAFYLVWFLVLALGIALVAALASPVQRPETLAALRRHGPGLAVATLLVGFASAPFLVHSIRAASVVGYREYDEVETFLPRLQSWIHFGSEHWLYGAMSGAGLFTSIPTRQAEHAIGFGFASTALSVAGLWSLRKTVFGRLAIAVSLTLLLITLCLPGGASLWALVYLVVPGAKAIRAVARVSLILVLPAAAGCAFWVETTRWRKPLAIAAALLAVLEQGRTMPTFDRRAVRDATAAVAARVDPSRDAFYYTVRGLPPGGAFLDSLPYRVHVDAMMASLVAGKPTLNGYSGWTPPDWPFEALTLVPNAKAEAGVKDALESWCRRSGLDPARVQWIAGGR